MIAIASVSSRDPNSWVVNGCWPSEPNPIRRAVLVGASHALTPVANRSAENTRMMVR